MNATSIQSEEKHFDQAALRYRSSWWGQRTAAGQVRLRKRYDRINAVLDKTGAKKILEIGCGSGILTEGINRPERRIWALDLSQELLKIARGRPLSNAFWIRSRADRLPFPDQSFDAVVGDGILHHIIPLEPVLVELKRVLKQPGCGFFFEPNMANPQIFLERKIDWIRRLHQTPDETAFLRGSIRAQLLRYWKRVSVEPFDFLHPSIPQPLIGIAESLGAALERCPGARELAGSLEIQFKESQ